MIIGVPQETAPGETRVAISPLAAAKLIKAGHSVLIEPDAGRAAGYTDAQYTERDATIAADRAAVFAEADVIAMVRVAGASPETLDADLSAMREGQVVIGFCEPLGEAASLRGFAEKNVTLFSMELMPRITRAQSMDALSSQSSLAGYRCVIIAAEALTKIFPMMMTAAGTITPAKVFIIGAGVAGLQAIATAKRLGAVVSATDVRPATVEQVESLGAKFVMVEEAMAEGEGGYAKDLTPEQKEKQKALVADVIAESDVVITTAAIPGRKAPVIVTTDMVERMQPGSVLVDLAAERGGNIELTQPDQTVDHHGVKIIGPVNIPAAIANHASQTYANNVTNFLTHLIGDDGAIAFDMDDEITAGTLVCRGGEIVHPRVREALDLPPLEGPAEDEADAEETTDTDNPAAPEGSDA